MTNTTRPVRDPRSSLRCRAALCACRDPPIPGTSCAPVRIIGSPRGSSSTTLQLRSRVTFAFTGFEPDRVDSRLFQILCGNGRGVMQPRASPRADLFDDSLVAGRDLGVPHLADLDHGLAHRRPRGGCGTRVGTAGGRSRSHRGPRTAPQVSCRSGRAGRTSGPKTRRSSRSSSVRSSGCDDDDAGAA